MWTLVGAGAKTLAESCKPMASLIPPQAKWDQTSVVEFHPDRNFIVTSDGKRINYEYLVVALGLQVNFNKVRSGLIISDLTYKHFVPRLKGFRKHCLTQPRVSPATTQPRQLRRRIKKCKHLKKGMPCLLSLPCLSNVLEHLKKLCI